MSDVTSFRQVRDGRNESLKLREIWETLVDAAFSKLMQCFVRALLKHTTTLLSRSANELSTVYYIVVSFKK